MPENQIQAVLDRFELISATHRLAFSETLRAHTSTPETLLSSPLSTVSPLFPTLSSLSSSSTKSKKGLSVRQLMTSYSEMVQLLGNHLHSTVNGSVDLYQSAFSHEDVIKSLRHRTILNSILIQCWLTTPPVCRLRQRASDSLPIRMDERDERPESQTKLETELDPHVGDDADDADADGQQQCTCRRCRLRQTPPASTTPTMPTMPNSTPATSAQLGIVLVEADIVRSVTPPPSPLESIPFLRVTVDSRFSAWVHDMLHRHSTHSATPTSATPVGEPTFCKDEDMDTSSVLNVTKAVAQIVHLLSQSSPGKGMLHHINPTGSNRVAYTAVRSHLGIGGTVRDLFLIPTDPSLISIFQTLQVNQQVKI